MRKITKIKEETLVDVAMEEYGGVEGIISAAKLNGLGVDATLTADVLMVIDEEIESLVRKIVPLNVVIVEPVTSSGELSIQNETVVEATMRLYDNLEGVVAFARDNAIAVDDFFAGLASVKVDKFLTKMLALQKPIVPAVYVPVQDITIVASGQNIIDLVLQEYGGVEGIISFLRGNGLAPTGDPTTNAVLKIDILAVSDKKIRDFFSGKIINTGYDGTIVIGDFELREDSFYILREDGSKFLRET
jgi:hypothetical protein